MRSPGSTSRPARSALPKRRRTGWLADIFRVDPRELIVAEPVFYDEALKPLFDMLGRVAGPQPPSLFDSASATQPHRALLRGRDADSFGSVLARRTVGDLRRRSPMSRRRRKRSGRRWRGRSARRTARRCSSIRRRAPIWSWCGRCRAGREGSLLRAIDRTVTGAGARLLAERLMAPLTDPAAIDERLDAVAFFAADAQIADALRQALKTRADMPRALSRLALNRGGPRDLGALRAGLAAAAAIDATARGLPAAGGTRRRARGHCRRCLPICAGISTRALADELPLLKRDGGFVRAGYDGELDEMRALRDQSRRVIAGMERDLIEETGIRSLKIRHNNVLGYYIEVTANHQAIMTGSDQAKARFIHRQTMASAMRFTTTELAELETQDRQCRRPRAGDRARRLRRGWSPRPSPAQIDPRRRAGARRARRVGRARRAGGCRELRPADRRRQPRLSGRGRAPSGGRAGAAAAGAEAVRRQ